MSNITYIYLVTHTISRPYYGDPPRSTFDACTTLQGANEMAESMIDTAWESLRLLVRGVEESDTQIDKGVDGRGFSSGHAFMGNDKDEQVDVEVEEIMLYGDVRALLGEGEVGSEEDGEGADTEIGGHEGGVGEVSSDAKAGGEE